MLQPGQNADWDSEMIFCKTEDNRLESILAKILYILLIREIDLYSDKTCGLSTFGIRVTKLGLKP